MIKRISMWKLADPACAEEMKGKLLSMKNTVDSLQEIEVGINESQHESAYDIVFIGTFSDENAFQRFENDEYHKEIGSFVSSVRLDRKVVEFEC
ncbi:MULTISPECIES: Dabb family protein [unclassified Ketobacter]|uniref:Dabb family protein n=1 Tax=unclassified Ketobacter TaxID=2639109 RepID=UPI000F106916|nr:MULTISPECIES: Dabb family protein [unclassified Ketobacter]RLT89216.1 MAG: Dabb family protein [Ketobacter sp. GenoA1]RLT93355.1 MAG: Dabb family protein [Ketobacter sp.]